jgi:hypothetical protein
MQKIQQLLNLQRVLVENKFTANSPSINFTKGYSEIANSIVEDIIQYYKEVNDFESASLWIEWRVLDRNDKEVDIVLLKIKELVENWDELEKLEKIRVLEIFASPYLLDPELIL